MPTASNKGNWETKEERDRRQILIIRQSCLSSAVNAFEGNILRTASVSVIGLAREFEAYVRGPDAMNQELEITGSEVE